jgi:hypothetical protein
MMGRYLASFRTTVLVVPLAFAKEMSILAFAREMSILAFAKEMSIWLL